jgi:urease subunit gamma/beta
MLLTPHEQDRVLVHSAADVARRRRERGLLLNHPEAVALLTDWVLEAARDGMTVAAIMAAGRDVLSTAEVMEGVEVLIDELQVEATFPDGTKLVTLHGPIQPALGAGPPEDAQTEEGSARLVPGEVLLGDGDIVLLEGRELVPLHVLNTADRPVQVGSHFHFAEANEALQFDRAAAVGRRLAVPAGTSVRFEPGIPMDVELVAFAGAGVTAGFRGLHSPGSPGTATEPDGDES